MIRIAAVIIFCLVPLSLIAQPEPPYRLGRIISESFLQRLTNPVNTEYRVGVVNVGASTGMLLSPQDARPEVKFMSGNQSWLWASAAEQIDSGDSTSIRFEVLSKVIDTTSCVALQDAHDNFYLELNRALSEDITLTSLPTRPAVGEITVDGTTFPIQIYTGRNHLTIMADRDVNRGLQQASYDLHRIVSGCSNDVDGIIEEHIY